MAIWNPSCLNHYLLFFLDLPKLHTILFGGSNVLAGDSRDNRKTTIMNASSSYDNTLIMKGNRKTLVFW